MSNIQTRSRRAACERACLLPREVWQLIISFLTPPEAVRAALVCTDFALISAPAAQQACTRLWPHHAERLAHTGVQRFYRLVQAHEDEVAAHPEVAKAKDIQKTVCPEHRQIAVEWLIEVSWDWQLESTVVYRGTQYLDHYLASHAVPALSKFQMLAISCLRTALKHSSKLAERERLRLPYKHWAEVTDGACTEAEVRSTCIKLDRMVHQQQRSHPNAKQRLRYLWYRLYDAGVIKQEHVYIYMLASFLLHLSLLDNDLSTVIPTKLATAALSLALKVFGFPPMPAVLEDHCFYLEHELLEIQQHLQRAQEEIVGHQLRMLWVTSYSYIGTDPSQQPAYTLLQQIVSACSKLRFLPANEDSSSSSNAAAVAGRSAGLPAAEGAAAPAVAAQADTAAAVPAAGSATATVPEPSLEVAPTGATVNRVMTRAAAAAGLVSSLRHQNTAAAAGADTSHGGRSAPSIRHASSWSSRAAPGPVTQQVHAEGHQGTALAIPQHLGMGSTTATPLANVAAVAEPGSDYKQQPFSGDAGGVAGGSSARRWPTRELPPRRAVAVSRYGMLASRGGTPPGDVAGASQGGRLSVGAAGVAHPHQDPGPSAVTPSAAAVDAPGLMAAMAGPSGVHARAPAAAEAAAGSAGPFAGSMTPASPKHAAGGTRGLAALFGGAGHGSSSGSSHTGMGSNTSRLLSGLSSLQGKFPMGEVAEFQQELWAEEPSWLWAVQQAGVGNYGSHGESSKAGPSSGSNNASLHMSSVPVLRSTRRAAAAAAAAVAASVGNGGVRFGEASQRGCERLGVHTRSSSGGAEAGSSH